MCYKRRYDIALMCVLALCLVFISDVKTAQGEMTASLQLKVPGDTKINATVKNVKDNQPLQSPATGTITWSNVSAGENWRIADQYVELGYNPSLPEFWGLQIYTDNTNIAIANPRYRGTGNPAGLVKVANPTICLPTAWVITDHILTTAEMNDPSKYKPIERFTRDGFTNYMWHYFKDKGASDIPFTPIRDSFKNAEDYVVLWNQSGIAWNEAGRSGKPITAYLYFAAKFLMANVNAQYMTNTLTIESYYDSPTAAGYHGVSPFPLYIYKNAPKTALEHMNDPTATLENHYAPSGWMQPANMSVEDHYANNPHSSPHCFKLTWNGTGWCGLAWLEPDSAGGPWIIDNRGYDLRGVTHLSFFARVDPADVGAKIKAQLGSATGNPPDSCGVIMPSLPYAWLPYGGLTTGWQHIVIPIKFETRNPDMSKVSLGFQVVLGQYWLDTHDPSIGPYTVYLDDIRYLAPEPVLTSYNFATDPQGWRWDNTPPDSTFAPAVCSNGAGYLRIKGNDLTPWKAQYGAWYYNHADTNIPIEGGRLYKAIFKVGTDVTTRNAVPRFRLLAYAHDFQLLSTTDVSSSSMVPDPTICPVLGTDRTYEAYLALPVGASDNKMALTFDYVNTFPDDSETGGIDLKEVIVREATNAIVLNELARFNFVSGTQGWVSDNTPPNSNFAPAVCSPGAGYLRIKGNDLTPWKAQYGKWYYNIGEGNLPLEAGYLYKAVFRIGTNVADRNKVPKFRLMLHSYDFQMVSAAEICSTPIRMDPSGSPSSCPVSGEDKTYEVYFTIPSGASNNKLALQFDYVNMFPDDSETGAIDLKEVIIYKVSRDAMNI